MSHVKALCSLLLFVAAFGFYTRNAAPSVTAGDSGEFITAAATLSLPHSPSFPTYIISARSFISALPFGSAPYRCNLFSAFTSALTLLLALWIAWAAGLDVLAGVAVALLLAFSASFWENSLVSEVFSLNILMAAAIVLVLLRIDERNGARWWLALFLVGLGAGNHQVLMFIGPVFAAVGWFERRWIWSPTLAIGGALAFLLGFSIYLVLPLRSRAEPPLNWGHPTTVAKLTHTILRKDYGTLTLALGEKPDRSFRNGERHIRFFVRQIAREVSAPVLVVGLCALGWGLWRRDRLSMLMTVGFIFSGPFFIWLGNLPLTAQSEGIIGRFLILPVFFLIAGLIPVLRQWRRAGTAAVLALAMFELGAGWSLAEAHRGGLLVLDYGRAMLRSLPDRAALFMDGGDDAFYSLAMLQNVLRQRPDVELHDRGGLVFRNPYGDDFRALPKDDKPARRWSVERARLLEKPLYYVTMDPHVLPGAPTQLNGIVVETGAPNPSLWPFYVLRSLYPPQPATYRLKALAAYFPFAYAQSLQRAGQCTSALNAYARAWSMGADVEWLKSNLSFEFSQWGYKELTAGRLDCAEAVYRQWLSFEPESLQAHSNLGVVLEKSGRIDAARDQYTRTARAFPNSADAVFNLSVLAWKRGDWAEVVGDLEEVLRRNPRHPRAAGYLNNARLKLQSGER